MTRLIDDKILLKNAVNLKKFIDWIAKQSNEHEICMLYEEYMKELYSFIDQVEEVTTLIKESIAKDLYDEFEMLTNKVDDLKRTIVTSKMYSDYSIYWINDEFKDQVLNQSSNLMKSKPEDEHTYYTK